MGINKGENYSSNNSPELSKKLSSSKIGEGNLESNIAFLKECGVSDEYLDMFVKTSVETTEGLVKVLGKNPSIPEVDLVNGSLDLVNLMLETMKEHTNKRIHGVILRATEDDFGLAT